MIRRTVVFLVLLVMSLAAVAFPSLAQNPPQASVGGIKGTVTDQSGAVVPGVVVTISGGPSPLAATSDEKGEYVIKDIPPGNYTLKAVAQGFTDFVAEGVVVRAGEPLQFDISLTTAGVATQVEVEGQTVSKVETESAQLAGTLTQKEVTTYALNGRNFTQLIALAPGVSNQTGQDEALVGVKGSVNYSVNGGRVEYNSYDVDGGDILNASINGSHSTLIVYPSLDAISELQVLTSNYGAMYGRSASGTILVSSKQGGSGLHGDGYFFLRNDALNDRNFFDHPGHAPLYRKYNPGGTIGGPLYIPGHYNQNKDKTFFFFSEEYRHDREPVDFNQGVPSLMERDCYLAANPSANCLSHPEGTFGDFSDVCPTNSTFFFRSAGFSGKDPNTGKKIGYYPDCPGRPYSGVSIEGLNQALSAGGDNLVPIDARSEALLNTNLIPLPNSTTGCNSSIHSCFVTAVSPLTSYREELFRIDHNFSPSQKVYVRYVHDAWSTQVPTPQWGFLQNSFPTVENQFDGPGTSAIAHYVATVKTRLVNDVAMAYTADHIHLTNFAGQGVTTLNRSKVPIINNAPCLDPSNTTCGLGWIFQNGYGGKIPGIVIAGTNQAYGGHGFLVDSSYMPWHHSNPTYSPRDDATLAWGKHTLQFGVLFIIAQRNEVNSPVGANTGSLQGIATFTNINNVQTTGNVFADFLQPYIQNFQQDSGQGVYHNNYKIAEPYVQDNWKISPKLTLNLGVRVSLFDLYREKYHQSFNWVPSQFSTALASQVSINPRWGNILDTATGMSLPLNVNNLDPRLINGIVQCGVGKYADGTKVPAGCMTNNLVNPAPRIGVAWDPFGNGKTSIRAGYGMFFEHGTGNEANSGSLEGSPSNASMGGVVDMTQYYPLNWGCIGNKGTNCPALGGTFPLNVTSIPTKAQWPYAQQWSFSVQRELPWNILASAAYVGSKGTHLTAELQVNQLLPVNQAQNPFQPGQPLTSDICSGFGQGQFMVNGNAISAGQPGYNNLLAACAGLALQIPTPNALRQPGYVIAPGMGQIFSLQNIANSNYNAMQFTLRRIKAPVTLGLSYTYSHSLDDSSDRTSANFINAYNIRQNRASSDFDQRHLLNINYIWTPPVRSWFEKFLTLFDDDETNQVRGSGMISEKTKSFLSDWELAGITIYSTGTPFSVINGGSPSGVSSLDNAGVAAVTGPGSYPDVLPSGSVINTSGFDQQASTAFGPLLGNPGRFVAPTGLTYGNAGRNYLNNPGRLNFDISITKNVKLKEDRSLQFRLETFNTFNHTQFRIYDPTNPGNPGNNIITCYGNGKTAYGYSAAGDQVTSSTGVNNSAPYGSCLPDSSFLHPVNAHRPRTIQLGAKFFF